VDFVQFLSDCLTYAADNVKALNAFEKCLDFISCTWTKQFWSSPTW